METNQIATPNSIRVLLVDDDKDDYFLTKDLFTEIPGNRYQLDWVGTYDAALETICANQHDVYLLDYRLGAKTGLDLLSEARCRGCQGPVIILTGQSQSEVDLAAMEGGAADFLEKSRLDAILLERSIRYAMQQKRYEAELERKVKARTEELAKANEALKEADRRKDEFLATLAHELRNPLVPIRNALEIMRLGANNPKSVEKCRVTMERQINQMVRLINDLLDVSRITRGKLRLDKDAVTLTEIIEDAIEISRPNLEKAQVQWQVTLPEESIILHADRIRLAQVFSNLLNNSAKYTEAGGNVSLSIEKSDTHILVRIRDTGVGIPPEVLPHLFEPFTQVDRTLNRSQGGLGIGLALVRMLVEMHGGTVEAHSEGIGLGAEFRVQIPLSTQEQIT